MDALVNGGDFCVEGQVVARKKVETKPGNRRDPVVRLIANNLQQFSRAVAALGRDDAEFGHMPADRIRQHRALPDQQLSGPVQHQASLLFLRLDRNKPHRWPRHGLTHGRLPSTWLLHATTLWHSDAAEWAPSTASITDIP